MIDNTPERENAQPRKEVQMGKWFKPFEDYAKKTLIPEGDKGFSKKFDFITPPIGKWAITTIWREDDYEDSKNRPETALKWKGIVILPDAERITSNENELFDVQEDIEKRLMDLGIMGDEDMNDGWYENPRDLQITLRLPSGKELYTDLSEVDDVNSLVWKNMDTDEVYDEVLIPDSPNIMGEIQMKIDETGGGEK